MPHGGAREIRELLVHGLDGDAGVLVKSTIRAVLGQARRRAAPLHARHPCRSCNCFRLSRRTRKSTISFVIAA